MLILLLLCLCVTANLTNAVTDPQRCVGGIQSDCQLLINESVLQTYISQFYIDQDYDDDYDIPFRTFTKTLNTSPNREDQKPYENRYAFNYELYPIPTVYLKRLDFKSEDLKEIMSKVVVIGTDIFRIKFHSAMVFEFQEKTASYGSYDENMVFVESTYYAISNYYFTKNYILAKYVAEDGINFLEDVIKQYQGDQTKMEEILVWEVLYHTLYLDIMDKIMCNVETKNIVDDTKSKITSREKRLNDLVNGKNYPKSYILMYRDFLLNKNLSHEKKEEFQRLAHRLTYNKEYKNNHMFSIYYELVASSIESSAIRALSLLIKAIFTPVKSIEDRVLNYKANEMAKELVKDCINENGWISQSNNILCNEVHAMISSDILKKYLDIMLIKYTREIMHTNIIMKLQNNLNSGGDIDENILHIIATEAIDMDLVMREKKLETVKRGIYLLDEYVSSNQLKSGNVKNTVVAYKWLAELYALFCTGKKRGIESKFYEDGVINALKTAIEISRSNELPIDKHLEFMVDKFNCREKIIVQRWEEGIERLDGWVFKDDNTQLPPHKPRKETEDMCTRIFYSFLMLDHRFIHKIDVFIHYYRSRMVESYKNFSNSIVSGYMKSAMSIPVFSSEDRYRNNAAHEIFSMNLLKFNATPDKFRTDHDILAQ